MNGRARHFGNVQPQAAELLAAQRRAMFVSQPQYEIPFPSDLQKPGSKHWRMVDLTLHVPWFLLSVEIVDAESTDCNMIRTTCIAYDSVLTDVLRSLDSNRVTGIVCMMPAWQSANGQWTSREIREVWVHSSDAGQSVVLLDANSQEFDCGLTPEHVHPVQKELVLRVAPAQPHHPQHGRRKVHPSTRYRREAGKRDSGS